MQIVKTKGNQQQDGDISHNSTTKVILGHYKKDQHSNLLFMQNCELSASN